jgi:hypothetical protein
METNITAIDAATTDKQSTIITLSKTYHFEEKDYTELDFSGLEDLSAEDMIEADKYLSRNGNVSAMPEMSIMYACFIASRATDIPVEFFRKLSPKDAIKVKNRVTSFFYGEG